MTCRRISVTYLTDHIVPARKYEPSAFNPFRLHASCELTRQTDMYTAKPTSTLTKIQSNLGPADVMGFLVIR